MDKKTMIFILFAISFFICVFAFGGCSNLTSITIPNSVTGVMIKNGFNCEQGGELIIN